MSLDITSANAVLMFSIDTLLPAAQQIQGFGTDDIFSVDSVSPTEVQMGLDGKQSSGFMYVNKKMKITLMASSPSNNFFDQWYLGNAAAASSFECTGLITLPALGQAYNLVNGSLTGYKPIADAKKVMQARQYEITFQEITPAPISAAG